MTKVIKFSFSLETSLYSAYEKFAGVGEATGLMRQVLHEYAMQNNFDYNPSFDIDLYRRLTNEVADMAETIVESGGWDERITLKAIQACQKQPDWIESYRRLIGSDDEFTTRNKIKASINQNFGHYVKVRLTARVKLSENGQRVTEQPVGQLIRSFTLLIK